MLQAQNDSRSLPFATLGPTRPIAALHAVRRNMSGLSKKGGKTLTLSKSSANLPSLEKKTGALNIPFFNGCLVETRLFLYGKDLESSNWNKRF